MRGAPARYGYAQKLKAKEKRKKKRIFFRWIVLTMSRYGAFFSFFFLLLTVEFTISTIVAVLRVSLKVIKMNELAMVKRATWRQRA